MNKEGRMPYANPAQWVRKHFNKEKHHYDKPGVKLGTILEIPRSTNGSATPFPGQAIKQLGKMPSVKSMVDHPDPDEYSLNDEHEQQDFDYGGSRRGTEETKAWDKFRVIPVEESNTGDQRCLKVTIRFVKVIAYIITYFMVLGGTVISKSLLLLETSLINRRTHVYCRNAWDKNHQYESEISEEERIAWIWAIFFGFALPEIFTLFRSLRICIFKSYTKSVTGHFLVVLLFETLHTIGLSLFVYVVLPGMDVIKGAMLTNCTCFLPGLLALFSRQETESKRFLKIIIDIFAIIAQLSGLILWPALIFTGSNTGPDSNVNVHESAWAIPLSLFLISCGWWENFVDSDSSFSFIKALGTVKDSLQKTRYFTYMLISIWKIIVFLASMVGFLALTGTNLEDLFSQFNNVFGVNRINIYHKTIARDFYETDRQSITSSNAFDVGNMKPMTEKSVADTPVYVFLIQVFVSLCAYIVGKFTCRICIQGFSYAFPINLTVPVTISLLIAACGLRSETPCFLTNVIPKYMYWECPNKDFFSEFLGKEYNWIWLFWLLSQTWITLHIWTPKCERLASTEKLFLTPMYSGLLVDQSLALNRRRREEPLVNSEEIELDVGKNDDLYDYYESIQPTSEAGGASNVKPVRSSDHITRIYACATMWHETSDEMKAMLKSIFRMDEDQCARRNAQKYLQVVDPDYYEFETHIFFDDAFEISDEDDDLSVVNRFVKLLVNSMDEAASVVHQTNIRLKPPMKLPTPYGGRLVWTLPGKTKMYAHLKDKMKIRHRKRWSQVMYMYYLLGHRIMETTMHEDRKAVIAENTYILTLDGDIDFEPEAVKLLVDLMRKNRNLGAACGRIHPIGSGPMVWYQKFEYAIGHWLQKATEHMIGCVLCSPGCFSLFRAKGLMDDNVMRKYTTQSDQARHYVQYDQGEDRWLCTLLLQRGYRVEYSAASDAYTHSPEGFGEFFNQRRRWVPSTMANIMDLLMDAKRTIAVNDNISHPYIFYQAMLMGGTILGPGTIFLMLVGAFVAAFKIDNWTSFYANIIPILLFMIVCFTAKPDHQILFAQILSALYALVMMAVIVGISLQMREDGIGAPSFIFLVALSGSFFIAALLHPQEFWCIVPGLLYYLSIPSMYLLLIIYSLCNLNIVSWGTREVQTKKTKKMWVAQILTSFYALVMMAVIVGTLLQVQEDGWTSPGTLFLLAISLTFVIAGLVHPLEISCLPHGILYYILIPSMYLLLMIYSVINLYNVTWGTREVKQKRTKQEIEEEKKQQEELKKKQAQSSHFISLFGKNEEDLEGGFSLSLANLFACQVCTHPKPKDEHIQLLELKNQISEMNVMLSDIKRALPAANQPVGLPRRKSMSRTSMHSNTKQNMETLNENDSEEHTGLSDDDDDDATSTQSRRSKPDRDDLLNPYWIEDKDLKKGPISFLPDQEIQFWKDLLAKYLHPIDEDKEHKAQIVADLKELRNKSVFAFFMLNALFILIVFLLQLNKDNLYVEWPLGVKYNITYSEDSQEIRVAKEYLHLEPIGLVFVFFFALIIIIQFLAMLFHRFGTLSHILASTDLDCWKTRPDDLSGDAFIKKNAVEIARGLQKLKGLDDDESESGSGNLGRRKTIHNLEKSFKRKQTIGTLDVAFRKRFMEIGNRKPEGTPILSGIPRMSINIQDETMRSLQRRRDTVLGDKSRMQTLGARNSLNNNNQRNRRRVNNNVANVFPQPNGLVPKGGTDNASFENEDNELRTRSPVYQRGGSVISLQEEEQF